MNGSLPRDAIARSPACIPLESPTRNRLIRIANIDQVMRHLARSPWVAFAVPISIPRYTCIESPEMISQSKHSASFRAESGLADGRRSNEHQQIVLRFVLLCCIHLSCCIH